MTLEEKQLMVSELGGVDLDIIKTWDNNKLETIFFGLVDLDAKPDIGYSEDPE